MQKFLLVILTLVLCACSAGQKNIEIQAGKIPLLDRGNTVVEQVDEPFFGIGDQVLLEQRKPLPKILKNEVVLSQRLTLDQLTDYLVKESGLKVFLHDLDTETLDQEMSVIYQGELSGLIEKACRYYDISWEYEDGAIQVYRYDTKSYSLFALPGEVTTESEISNSNEASAESSGASGAAGDSEVASSQSSKINIEEMSAWEDTIEGVKTILSEDGKVVANRSAGVVTVTDYPSYLDRVEEYITQVNRHLSRQVAVDVKVYAVQLENSSEAGIDLTAIFQDLDDHVRAGLVNSGTIPFTPGASSLTTAILQGARDDGEGLGQWTGSELLVQALKTKGNVSLVTSGSGIVLNNQALPMHNITRDGYLAEVSVTVVERIATTALTPGSVTTGFSMILVPHVFDENKVALQYNVSLSNLDSLDSFSSGENQIQTPKVSSRSFMQRASMRLGSTLVLAGFEQEQKGHDSSLGILSVGEKNKDKKVTIIVAITVNDATIED